MHITATEDRHRMGMVVSICWVGALAYAGEGRGGIERATCRLRYLPLTIQLVLCWAMLIDDHTIFPRMTSGFPVLSNIFYLS